MSRLAKLRKEQAENVHYMKTFCLNPNREIFSRICTLRDGHIPIFRLACLFQYAEEWGLNVDPNDSSKRIENIQTDFLIREREISEKAISAPSKTNSMKVLYLYYALGELKHIDLFYQCMGHEGIPHSSRVELAELFRETRSLYQAEIMKLRAINPNHFENYDMNEIDFKYFDTMKERALAEKKRIEEHNNMLISLNSNNTNEKNTHTKNHTKNHTVQKRPETTMMPTQIYGISQNIKK